MMDALTIGPGFGTDMKFLQRETPLLFFLSLVLTDVSCDNAADSPSALVDTTGTSIGMEMIIDTSYVRYDSLGNTGLGAFYTKFFPSEGLVPRSWGDSVVALLLDSNIDVFQFWQPADVSRCLDPYVHEREIVHLVGPDSAMIALGFTAMNPGFMDRCIPYWKRYRILHVAVTSTRSMRTSWPVGRDTVLGSNRVRYR
jgi:hypothetical protein